jgi:hypothetical protein
MTVSQDLFEEVELVGAPEPGLLRCYREAFGALLDDPVPILCMALLALGAGIVSWQPMQHGGGVGLLGCALGVFVAIPVAWTLDYLCLQAVRGEAIRERDLRLLRRRYADLVIAGAAVSLAVVAGLFLAVVPGIVLYCRLRFVPYLVLDEGLPAREALRASLELTRGSTWPIFWVSAVGAFLWVFGLGLFVVGAAAGDAMGRLATASLYHATVEPTRELGSRVVS